MYRGKSGPAWIGSGPGPEVAAARAATVPTAVNRLTSNSFFHTISSSRIAIGHGRGTSVRRGNRCPRPSWSCPIRQQVSSARHSLVAEKRERRAGPGVGRGYWLQPEQSISSGSPSPLPSGVEGEGAQTSDPLTPNPSPPKGERGEKEKTADQRRATSLVHRLIHGAGAVDVRVDHHVDAGGLARGAGPLQSRADLPGLGHVFAVTAQGLDDAVVARRRQQVGD